MTGSSQTEIGGTQAAESWVLALTMMLLTATTDGWLSEAESSSATEGSERSVCKRHSHPTLNVTLVQTSCNNHAPLTKPL